MSAKFLIQFVRTGAELLVTYNEKGTLIESRFEPGTMEQEPEQVAFVRKAWPMQQRHLEHWRGFQNVTVSEVPDDLSFDRFWTQYAHKIGNKKRSERLWNDLTDAERHKVFKHLVVYQNFLTLNPQTMKKYPETYLQQQPWNN